MSASPATTGATSLRDVGAVVLVVGVGVDDDVGAELQARVEAGLEGVGQALVVGQADDVVDAVGLRDLDGAVGGAVVDDRATRPRRSRGPRAAGPRASRGSVCSSLKQGIWMISFIGSSAPLAYLPRWRARPSPGRGRCPLPRRRRWPLRSTPSACSWLGCSCSALVGSSSTRRTRTTTRTTRCCGRASRSTARCRCYEAYRAPTQHPLATLVRRDPRAARPRGRAPCGSRCCVLSFVALVVGVYRLAREAFTPLVGARRRRADLHALRLPVLRRARLHRHRLHGARRLGGGARGRAAPRRGTPVLLLLALAGGAAPRGVAHERPVLAVGRAGRRAGASASQLRRAGGARAAHRGPAPTSIVTGDPMYSLTYTSDARRGARAQQGRRATSRPRCGRSSSSSTSSRCSSAASLGLGAAVVLVPRRIVCRSCCSSSASARSRCSASPASASSTATCSSPSLMVMVFAAVGDRGLDDAREGHVAAAGLGGRGGARSSSTGSSSQPRG